MALTGEGRIVRSFVSVPISAHMIKRLSSQSSRKRLNRRIELWESDSDGKIELCDVKDHHDKIYFFYSRKLKILQFGESF